jgi:3,4-dihydroxy 2-butanone 4-phosphate synthase/GTP cyclohydrolase II
MAGYEPAALIVEIMNEDGTMARRPELEAFAERHQLRMGTIADLIAYRSLHEQSVERVGQKPISTEHGEFTLHSFRDLVDETLHFALTRGELSAERPCPVRVQSVELLRDVIGTQLEDDNGWSLRRAMERIATLGEGAVVLIGQETSRERQLAAIEAFPATLPASPAGGDGGLQNYRIIGTGAQILQQLGIGRMQLMSAPLRFNALSGFRLEVVDFLQP